MKQTDLKLLTNQQENIFFDELAVNLHHCRRFYFSVAFINFSGLQLLLDTFRNLDNQACKGKIITSTYLNFTDVASLQKLNQFKNIETKIFIADKYQGFHSKGYIFEFDTYYKIIVGSSNITQSALKTNVEWNVRYVSKDKEHPFAKQVFEEFHLLWDQTNPLNEGLIEQYKDHLNTLKASVQNQTNIFSPRFVIKENSMQSMALKNLAKLRKNHQNKALIIAATGTGKTYLSAFDARQFKAKKLLFLVHREVILKDAMKTYQRILPDKTITKFQGQQKILDADMTFAMVRSMHIHQNYREFDPTHFDYIVIDEAHRSYSPMYQELLNYFNPSFLLGMTATPERTDGGNIFELFNNNIAIELRLRDSLKEDLVLPFHYFGINDVDSIDLSTIDVTKIDEVAKRLSIKDRVDLIIEKMEHYGYSGDKRKALGFCVSKEHAQYMCDEFNAFGYPSVCLTGESSDQERHEAIKKLESNTEPLEVIFTVDIFNEGIDIPTVNVVLMLRPTQSPIIFTQQLGRGLRKHVEKEFLTVLDFIGNHNKSFLIPIALSGSRYYDKDSLKVQLTRNFSDIPGCTHIHLDHIAKERIFNQLDRVNFNDYKYLREEYQEFKNTLQGKTPLLVDYIAHENAPDPVKFILKEDSYIEFAYKVEKKDLTFDETVLKIQRSVDKQLPIKRINEFAILKTLFEQGSVSVDEAKKVILKIVTGVDDVSIDHSFRYLAGEILGPNEKNLYWYIERKGASLTLLDKSFIHNKTILESLTYGILRYQEEFGKDALSYPYLKKYIYYKMKDMGFLTNYNKSFASIRGSGVWKHGDHYYLFVDLHKGENISQSINYKDKLLSRTHMQWQTQNKTTQDSEVGRDLTHHHERGKHLHMFLRKAKEVGTQKLDYIYVGKVNTVSYEDNKPITIQFTFETPIPRYLYDDLTLI